MGEQYICQSCSYKWTSRKDWGEPSTCPSCKSDDILMAETHREKVLHEAKEKRELEKKRNGEEKYYKSQRKKGLILSCGRWVNEVELKKKDEKLLKKAKRDIKLQEKKLKERWKKEKIIKFREEILTIKVILFISGILSIFSIIWGINYSDSFFIIGLLSIPVFIGMLFMY